MIKTEDLPKYVGKEVFTKKRASSKIGSIHIAHVEPAKGVLTSLSLTALNGSVGEISIKVDAGDYYFPPLKNKDLYATEEECQKECLKELNEDILRAKEYLTALETKRKEWEK